MPAVYFPILVMLLALVFRGVAFEFRFRDAEHGTFWDHGFCYGSAVATFAQGVVLGAFIQGFEVEGRHFAGELVRLLHAVLAAHRRRADVRLWPARRGLADPEDRRRIAGAGAAARPRLPGRRRSSPSASSACGRRCSSRDIAQRWFSWPNIAFLRAGADRRPPWSRCWHLARARPPTSNCLPFIGAVGLFALSYLGIAISLWPMIVPHHYHAVAGGLLAGTQVSCSSARCSCCR